MHGAHQFQNSWLGPHIFEPESRNRTILLPLIAPYLKTTSVFSALLFLKHTMDKISSQFCCCFGQSTLPSIYVFHFCRRATRLNCLFFSKTSVFWLIEYQHMNDSEDRSKVIISTTLSERCSLVFSMFFPFHCQTFDWLYCFRQLISRLPDQTAIIVLSTYLHISLIFWMLANKYR